MISIKNINKWYGDFQVLTDCSTDVKKGEVIVVCGPSGSGKSTLIKCVNALEPFQKGDVVVDGTSIADPKTDLPKLRSRVGMVFQHFERNPTQPLPQQRICTPPKDNPQPDLESRGDALTRPWSTLTNPQHHARLSHRARNARVFLCSELP